jgi:cyclase
MLTKRIIPCLDIKDGKTVKGVNFENLRDAGDPVMLAQRYVVEGADELVFLDITATVEKRKTLAELVRKVAREINIPFTVGGGIGSIEDVRAMLDAGADKVSINSAAVKNPILIDTLAHEFGSQCIVVAVDTNILPDTTDWYVYVNGGRTPTDKPLFAWVSELYERGAGEILLTSMVHDGTKNGFACEITAQVSESVGIPVIASGGAGKREDFAEVFANGKADAALAASVFHFKEIEIRELKGYLRGKNIIVRQ